MAHATFNVLLRLLIALTLVVFTVVAGPCVLGQTPVSAPADVNEGEQLAPSTAEAPPATAVELRLPSEQPAEMPPPSQPAAGAEPGFEGYWIASSWKCRQHRPHGCACGDLDYYHVPACGAPQHLNRDAFQASLTPGVPVCVVVHGSFTNWMGLCDECSPLYRWLRGPAPQRRVQMVFYTWPSDGPITYEPHIDVALLGRRASFNSVYLADLIARIPAGNPVCVVGHSHGCRMAMAGLHLLAGGEVEGVRLNYPPPPTMRLRSVLLAAAMDHHWLNPNERYGLALCRVEAVFNVRNDYDVALAIYPLRRFFSHRALGDIGLNASDRQKLGPQAAKVAEVDVGPLIGPGHTWRNYHLRPEIAAWMEPYVYYSDAPTIIAPAPAPATTPTPAQPVRITPTAAQR